MFNHTGRLKRGIIRGLSKTTALLAAAAVALSVTSCAFFSQSGGNQANGEDVSSEPVIETLSNKDAPEAMVRFLERFTDWYRELETDENHYDCENAGDGQTNVLRSIIGNGSCVDWSLYPVSKPEKRNGASDPDPRGWTDGDYLVYSQKDAEWIAAYIFNVKPDDLAGMKAQGESNGWFYLEDGKYYVPAPEEKEPDNIYTVIGLKTDGTRYFVEYAADFRTGEPEFPQAYLGAYYAEVALKKIDGREYWVMYHFKQTDYNR